MRFNANFDKHFLISFWLFNGKILFIQQAIELDHVPENATAALKLAYELAYKVAEQYQWTAEELTVYDTQEMDIHRNPNVLETAPLEWMCLNKENLQKICYC